MSRQLTVEEAKALGLYQHYEFSPEGEHISTQYGSISVLEWFEREKKRIEQNQLRRAVIVRKKKNSNVVALFVNAPAVCKSEAHRLGYSPLTEWSAPDIDLKKLGYVEPLQGVVRIYEISAANGKYDIIVRQDDGDHFAIFTR